MRVLANCSLCMDICSNGLDVSIIELVNILYALCRKPDSVHHK